MSNTTTKTFYINRRNFLKGSTAALALSSFGAYGLDLVYSPRKIRAGLIGCGWYGRSDLFKLIQVANVEVVSLCDVDQKHLEETAKLVSERQKSGRKPRLYKDYRKMLTEKDLDLVLIGSPDHWHALQAIEAMESGAHLYLQKPISLDVLEGEAILATARKLGKKVQVGTQRRSTPHLVEGKKNIIDAGLLGKISHVDICCYYHMRWNANPPVQQVPDYFDYDFWSGPAPLRPFVGLPHRTWRAFIEYGNGIVGDMCVHMLDTVRWMLGLGWPKKVSSTGGIYVQKDSIANISDTQTAIFEFDELNCIWQHRSWGTPPDPEYPWAFFIYGEKGTFKGSVYQYEFIPNDGGETIKKDVVFEREQYPEDIEEKDIELHTAPATRAHMLDLLAAIENDTLPVADVEQGHISTASCIMANLSMDLERPLIYNPQKRIIVDDLEATALLKRPYRGDWQHPSDAKT